MAKFNLKEFDDFGARSAGKERAFAQQQHAAPLVVQPQKEKAERRAKMPMMNIRFTPDNYEYMRKEAAMRGLSVIAFTNLIIDEYRAVPEHVHENDVFQNPEKW